MLYQSDVLEEQAVLGTAARMCAAARTAPKTKGRDMLHTLVLTGEEKEELARRMEGVGRQGDHPNLWNWYGRDAANVRSAQAVVMIGMEKQYRGVAACGFCGFADCGECKNAGGNCAFSYVDLGIAVSSAVSIAALDHVDNRIMYSIGKAAEEMDFSRNCLWLGIPLSVSGKSVFFDRNFPG